MSNIIEIEQHL